MKKLLVLLMFLTLNIYSCKKDDVVQTPELKMETTKTFPKSFTLSDLESIRKTNPNFFKPKGNQSNLDENTCIELEPIWNLAKEVKIDEEITIVTVPIYLPETEREDLNFQYNFFRGDDGIEVELFTYSKFIDDPNPMDLANFTGSIFIYNISQDQSLNLSLIDGYYVSYDTDEVLKNDGCNGGFEGRCRPWPSCMWNNGCYDFEHGAKKARRKKRKGQFGNGSDTDPYVPTVTIILTGNRGYPNYGGIRPGNDDGTNDSPSEGSGGVSSNGTPEEPDWYEKLYSPDIFNGDGGKVVDLLVNLMDENNLYVCMGDLYDEIQECLKDNTFADYDGGSGDSHNGSLISLLGTGIISHPCIRLAIENHQSDCCTVDNRIAASLICELEEINTTGIPDEEIYNIILEDCTDKALDDWVSLQFSRCSNELKDCINILDDFTAETGITFTEADYRAILLPNGHLGCDLVSTQQKVKELRIDAFLENHGLDETYRALVSDCYRGFLNEACAKESIFNDFIDRYGDDLGDLEKELLRNNFSLISDVENIYEKHDWNDLTDDEKIEIILKAIGWQRLQNRCLPDDQKLQLKLDDLFSNLPTWSTNSQGDGVLNGEFCLAENLCNIGMELVGSNSCDCISLGINSRDLGNNVIAYDFWGCGISSGSVPCLVIRVSAEKADDLENYFDRTDIECP